MNTTVKRFMLDYLTDQRFEMIVNELLKERARYYNVSDELYSMVDEFISELPLHYPEPNTFEIIEEIKKVSTTFVSYYRDEFESEILGGLWDLSQFSMSWMPSEQTEVKQPWVIRTTSAPPPVMDIENEPPLEDDTLDWLASSSGSENVHATVKEKDEEYSTIQYIECALIPKGYIGYDDRLAELDEQNYKEIINQFKPQLALALVNFVYEVIHYSNPNPLASVFGELTNDTSYVKITEDSDCDHGYGMQIYLEDRSMYASKSVKEHYEERTKDWMESDPWYRKGNDVPEFPVTTPEYIRYVEMIEDLDGTPQYLFAPFTFYLNEEITVPSNESQVIDDLLFQFIHVLTFQGFTKEEQVDMIRYANEYYEQVMS